MLQSFTWTSITAAASIMSDIYKDYKVGDLVVITHRMYTVPANTVGIIKRNKSYSHGTHAQALGEYAWCGDLFYYWHWLKPIGSSELEKIVYGIK